MPATTRRSSRPKSPGVRGTGENVFRHQGFDDHTPPQPATSATGIPKSGMEIAATSATPVAADRSPGRSGLSPTRSSYRTRAEAHPLPRSRHRSGPGRASQRAAPRFDDALHGRSDATASGSNRAGTAEAERRSCAACRDLRPHSPRRQARGGYVAVRREKLRVGVHALDSLVVHLSRPASRARTPKTRLLRGSRANLRERVTSGRLRVTRRARARRGPTTLPGSCSRMLSRRLHSRGQDVSLHREKVTKVDSEENLARSRIDRVPRGEGPIASSTTRSLSRRLRARPEYAPPLRAAAADPGAETGVSATRTVHAPDQLASAVDKVAMSCPRGPVGEPPTTLGLRRRERPCRVDAAPGSQADQRLGSGTATPNLVSIIPVCS